MSSSTFSSKRWLQIFFALVIMASVGFLVASEWLVRTLVVPQDNFEWIAARLRNSQQASAAFGDSHVAAVPDYNTADFVNLGIGATTIRKMDQRVRYYFGKIKPNEVIIQADPHLFADYRLEQQASYVPEAYSQSRLRVLDPRHRSFMIGYWTTLLETGQLKEKANTGYDQLWDSVARTEPVSSLAAVQAAVKMDAATLTKFNAFMDYEVATHTPASNFRQRDEARIYQDLIKFLISRGAKVCLLNYPVDKYYRERADRIPAFADTRKFYVEVARENHIPYVSFWDRFDDPSMFQNTDHVNRNGSPILVREALHACFGKPAP